MAGSRWRRYSDALIVFACEVVAFVFFLRASTLLGTVDFAHLGTWLQSTSPDLAFTAMLRLLGLAVSGWLLLSTLLYAAAALSGQRRLVAKSRLITVPALRRVVDSLAVASVAASSIGTAAAVSGATPKPHITAITRPIEANRPRPRASTGPRLSSAIPARVSSTAIGRHFPHPGRVDHAISDAAPIAENIPEVPSEENGFAGLPPGTKVIVVQPGDCLSVLAEEHLGDWRLDSEIEALNYGRMQPDGRALVDDHWIYVGWVLVMPSNAVGTTVVGGETSRQPGDGAGPSQHPHKRETSAEAVAPRQGDPKPVSKTKKMSTATTAPPSSDPPSSDPPSSDPPSSVPSTTISAPSAPSTSVPPTTIPRTTVPAAGAPTTTTPVTSVPTTGTTTATTARKAAAPMAADNTTVETPDTLPPPPARPSSGHNAQDGHRDSQRDNGRLSRKEDESETSDSSDSADVVLAAGIAAGIGAIAGGAIVWSLDRSRRQFGYWRPKGQPIRRNSPDVEAAERRARAIAEPEKARWVDQAVRYFSGLVEEMSLEGVAPVPSLALLRVGAGGLEVFVSPEVNGSLGWFSPTDDGTTLLLDSDVTLEELEALAAEHWPAWPALVSLGEMDEGELLLNLEHSGSLSVEGPGKLVQGALGRMVLELASQPWSDEMLAGLYAVGDAPLGTVPGLQKVSSDKAFDLAEKLDRVSGAQQEQASSVSISALRAVACEALPNVVIAFTGTPASALQCLAEAALPHKSGVAVAGAGPYEGARWKAVLATGGQGTLQGQLGDRPVSFVFKTSYEPEEVALLGEALHAAAEPGAHAGSRASSQPDQSDEEFMDERTNDGHGHDAPPVEGLAEPQLLQPQRGDVEICVLGPVDVNGGDVAALEPSRRMAALSLLAYMASHERPITADEIASALWPLDANSDNINGPQRKTVMNLISRARSVLGYNAAGKERIAYSPQGYRLSADVTSDWARFEQYLTNARRQPPADAIASLRRALELVRGEPFGGTLSSQFFEWVASEHLDMTFSARAVDAAEDLGQLALDAGDLETVVWAVEKGLLLEPTREELFRLWMHALGRAGRPAKVDDLYRRLTLVIRQRLHPLQEPQAETREVWRLYTAPELSNRPL
jgi:DNA-binding SARP family transcriptional activator